MGDPVEREALYVVCPVMGGKRLQPVTLVCDDGTEVAVPTIPTSEVIDPFDGRRVTVLGEVAGDGSILEGPVRVCAGEVDRCRMDTDEMD